MGPNADFIRNQRNHPLACSLESTEKARRPCRREGMPRAPVEDPICGISLRKPFQWMPIRGIVAMGRRGSATSPAIGLAPCSPACNAMLACASKPSIAGRFVPSVVKRVSILNHLKLIIKHKHTRFARRCPWSRTESGKGWTSPDGVRRPNTCPTNPPRPPLRLPILCGKSPDTRCGTFSV